MFMIYLTEYLALIVVVAVAGIAVYSLFGRRRDGEKDDRVEQALRFVLIGTFLTTLAMLVDLFGKNGSFPDIPEGLLTIDGIAAILYVAIEVLSTQRALRESQIKVNEARSKSFADPNNAKYSYQLAAATLEDYMNRNLSQVKWIFIVAVVVMLCGFAVICYGVSIAKGDIHASLATSGAGIVTQFIGATFMVLYRSTMLQARHYVTLLERINNIGMAIQILDTMDDSPSGLKNKVRADIVNALATQSRIEIAPNPGRSTNFKPNTGRRSQRSNRTAAEVEEEEI